MSLINWIVSASNIYGLVPIYYSSGYHRLWISTVVSASVLMHLSERKHGLPGIYPFNKYSNLFLWCDRIMAYSIVLYSIWNWPRTLELITTDYTVAPIMGVGLTSLLLSEGLVCSKGFFAFTHSIWHVCAFHLCYLFI